MTVKHEIVIPEVESPEQWREFEVTASEAIVVAKIRQEVVRLRWTAMLAIARVGSDVLLKIVGFAGVVAIYWVTCQSCS